MVKEGADKSDSINARCSSALLRASCLPKVIVKESAASSCRLMSLLMASSWVKTGDSLIARMYRPLILLLVALKVEQILDATLFLRMEVTKTLLLSLSVEKTRPKQLGLDVERLEVET